jgi:hypothetical protein
MMMSASLQHSACHTTAYISCSCSNGRDPLAIGSTADSVPAALAASARIPLLPSFQPHPKTCAPFTEGARCRCAGGVLSICRHTSRSPVDLRIPLFVFQGLEDRSFVQDLASLPYHTCPAGVASPCPCTHVQACRGAHGMRVVSTTC